MPGTDPFVGITLGSYEILEAIGEGGMARIYKGYHAELNRYAAIKVVHWGLQEDLDFTERFRREAQAIASLRHPNIVQIYDFGKHESGYYMAMEFVDGSDLAVMLRHAHTQQTYLPPEETTKIIKGVASALDYAHRNGVIHRDVKPSNIMINRDGQPILTDFGLVMLPLQSSQVTLGSVFGTPHYVAPEQAISSADAVPASDIYSLGVVLFEMATNRVPFDDPSPLSVALKHVSDAPPSPVTLNPNLPLPLEDVILKALSKTPADRFATAGGLAQATAAAFAGETVVENINAVTVPARAKAVAAVKPVAAPPPVAKSALPGWFLMGLMAIMGGLVGAGGFFIFNYNFAAPAATPIVVAVEPTLTPTFTPSPTGTPSPTFTATPTATPTFTPTPTASPTNTPTPPPTNTATPVPATPTAAPPTPLPPPPQPAATATPEGLAGKILFKTDRAGLVQIYQMNADGSDQRPLVDISIYTELQTRLPFSPDGQNQILVKGEGQLDLWWINFVTGQELRLTSTGKPEYDPAWSPVDNRIVFVSEETGNGDIYMLNLGGSALKRITVNDGNFDKHPTWSPDGTKIAFWSDRGFGGNRQVWAVDLATDQTTSLSDNPYNDWDPIWVWK